MNLHDTDFALFGLPERFAQDRAAIDARWKELQREAHPDRSAAQGAAAQRIAMQWSVRINEAYRRLKDPLARAAYLCELRGAPIDAERNTAMPADFLVQQMQWREALDEASTLAGIDALHAAVRAAAGAAQARCRAALDDAGDAQSAAEQVRAWMFVERFAADIDAKRERLETA